MSQFRQNPITGQWVSIAPKRAERPSDFADASLPDAQASCPFCEGNEQGTPEEVLALRPAGSSENGPGWTVRVVTNKYPFVANTGGNAAPQTASDLLPQLPGVGVQEVIIESPRHVTRMTDLTPDEVRRALGVYRQRLRQLRESEEWAYALLFKNSGAAAGASLEHIHSQLIALPFVPPAVQQSVRRQREYFGQTGRYLISDMILRELNDRERVVCQSEHFVVLCPFASRQPYEMLVIPRFRAANFCEIADDALTELAALLRRLTALLESALEPLAFNWMFNTSPFDTISSDHYHWHVEIVPRVTNTAGYEWATGNAVNIVSPEAAAARLRRAEQTLKNL